MKKTMRLMAMLLMAATMMFAACDKDDDGTTGGGSNPQPTPQPQQKELVGTSWLGTAGNSFSYQSITMNYNAQFTMDFLTDTTGEMFADLTVEVPVMPSANQHQTETSAFTYTFDGTNLILTDESGIGDTLTYNASDNTIIMNIPAEAGEAFAEMGLTIEDVLGSDKIVFNQTRK